MTACEMLTRAADQLDTLSSAATPGPWTVTEKSARWGGIVSVNSPVATDSEIEGYGGELVGESMSPENRALVAAMRGVAVPLAQFLRDSATELANAGDLEGACECTVVDGWHDLERVARALLDDDSEATR